MINKIFSIAIVGALVFSSCNTTAKNSDNTKQHEPDQAAAAAAAEQDVPFTIANRYFVSNKYKDGDLKNPKISDQEQFDELFGMATIMGPNGKPTPIDFSRQYVVTVIGELTGRGTEISPVSLKQQADTILLSYKMTEHEKSMVTIRPVLLIIVDNKYQGEVKLVKVPS